MDTESDDEAMQEALKKIHSGLTSLQKLHMEVDGIAEQLRPIHIGFYADAMEACGRLSLASASLAALSADIQHSFEHDALSDEDDEEDGGGGKAH